MSPEPIQTPETVESLRSDVLDLKTKITRQNIVNNISQLTLPPTSQKWYEGMPEVLITESSIDESEQDQLPFTRQAFPGGDIHKKLVILPQGLFSDSLREINDIFSFNQVIECYALIKRPDFRVVVEAAWKNFYEKVADDSVQVDNAVDQYIEIHKLELLKELKADMESALGRISSF